MNRDSLVMVAFPLVALACCLGLPIFASVGVGAAALVLGLGLPLALVAAGIGWIAVRRHRRLRRSPMATTAPATPPVPGADTSARR